MEETERYAWGAGTVRSDWMFDTAEAALAAGNNWKSLYRGEIIPEHSQVRVWRWLVEEVDLRG